MILGILCGGVRGYGVRLAYRECLGFGVGGCVYVLVLCGSRSVKWLVYCTVFIYGNKCSLSNIDV